MTSEIYSLLLTARGDYEDEMVEEAMKIILELPAEEKPKVLNAPYFGGSILTMAIEQGYPKHILQFLIEQGVNVNEQYPDNDEESYHGTRTPLEFLIYHDISLDTIKMFVEHGAEITPFCLYFTDGADDDDECFGFLESNAPESVLKSIEEIEDLVPPESRDQIHPFFSQGNQDLPNDQKAMSIQKFFSRSWM